MMPMGRRDTDSLTNPRKWPLFTPLESRDTFGNAASLPPVTGSPPATFFQGARLINGYVEKTLTDGDYWIFKRPGFSSLTTGPGGGAAGLGLFIPANNAAAAQLSVFGTTFYQNGLSVGSITGLQNPVFWQAINFDGSNHANVLVNGLGAGGYYYSTVSTTLTKITDVNFPTQLAAGWAYLDGFIYCMDGKGRIYESVNQNDPTTWSALDTILASSNSDAGVMIAKQLNYIIAFKQWSTQVFYDAANPTGSSLGPVPDAQIPVGCLDANTVQSIDDTLLWVSSSQSISPKIMQMDDLRPQVVSTPMVERLIQLWQYSAAGLFPFTYGTGIYSFTLKIAGHRFYGLTLLALNLTLIYDLDQKQWFIWTDPSGNYFPYISAAYQAPGINTPTTIFMQNLASGYYQSINLPSVYPTDSGTVFPVDIYTTNYDGGSVRSKTLNAMYFDTDIVRGSKLLTRFSDDDYNSWTQFRETDLGLTKPFIDQEGTFDYRRAYHLRHMGAQPFRIKAGYLQLDYGTL